MPEYIQDLGDGMKIGIVAKRQYFPDGTEFEGAGIKPDLEVQPSVECNLPRFFPSSRARFFRLNPGNRVVIARARGVAA